jgi:hypothetical protein
MYACFGLIHLPYTESMRSETPRQLSQDRVRLHVNWVNAEWDSTSTESTQRAHLQRFHVNLVNIEWDSTSNESMQRAPTFTKISIPCWLSWRGVSLRVDTVDMESHLALTQLTGNETPRQLSHRQMLKIWISRRIQERNWKHSKALLFGLYMFDQCKKTKKTSKRRPPNMLKCSSVTTSVYSL